jgi:uncharacterized protein (TIGR03086 family)
MDDVLAMYQRTSDWTVEKVARAADRLDAPTPNDDWDVRALLNHMIDTQNYFAGSARGEQVAPPASPPPSLLGSDPAADLQHACQAVVDAYQEPGVMEKKGASLGIAFSDLLLHGWDVARATNQDATMPDGLADAAYSTIYGRFTDEQRPGIFKPAIAVPETASPQQKYLAYTGRNPE